MSTSPQCAQAQPARGTEAGQDAAEPEDEALEDDEGAVPLQQTEQYEGDSYRDEEPERPVGPPMSLDAPSVRPLGEASLTACMGMYS